MTSAGTLNVTIGADTSGFDDGMRRAQGTTSRLRTGMNRGVRTAARYGTALAAAGAAITASLVRSGLRAVDEQAKLARQLDATTAGLEGYRRAAEDAGVSANVATSSAERLNQRLGEAMRGTGQAADALERLGLNARELAAMDVDERMAALSDAMHEGRLNSAQMADELRNLGIRNREMVRVMQEGGDAIRDATEEMRGFGTSLSAVDATQVEQANDAMSRIGDVIQGISNQLAAEFAPLLEGIASKMTDAAGETRGFRHQIESAVEFGVRGFAFLSDAVEGVRRTFVIAGQAAAQAFVEIRRGALEAAQFIEGTLLEQLQNIINIMRALPGGHIAQFALSGIDTSDVSNDLEQARRMVEEGRQAMHETLMEPMPSEGIMQWVDDVRAASEMAAIETVEARERMAEAQAQADERDRERRLENNERLREILGDHLNLEMDMMRDAQETMTDIEKRNAEARKRIVEAEARQKERVMGDALQGLTTLMNSESRKMFEIGKAAAISQSLISTYQGMSKALELGWPLGPIAASAIGAAGFANVQSIRSQSFGSGGSGGGASSNTQQVNADATPTGQQGGGQAGPNTIINLEGDVFGRDQVRDLLERINEEGRDGGRITLA